MQVNITVLKLGSEFVKLHLLEKSSTMFTIIITYNTLAFLTSQTPVMVLHTGLTLFVVHMPSPIGGNYISFNNYSLSLFINDD